MQSWAAVQSKLVDPPSPTSMMRVPKFLKNCSMSVLKQKREPEGASSLSSANVEGAGAGLKSRSFSSGRSSGNQIHPLTPDQSTQKRVQSALQPTGILRSGVTCVHLSYVPRLQSESTTRTTGKLTSCIPCIPDGYKSGLPHESLASPLNDPNSRSQLLANDVSNDVINPTSSEITGRLSPVPATYPISAQGQSSSSSDQSKDKGERHPSPSMVHKTFPTEPSEDSTLQQSGGVLSVAFETETAGNPTRPPPPECSQCNNEHWHSASCNPSRFSSKELEDVVYFSLDNRSGYKHDNLYRGELDGRPVFVARKETERSLVSEVDILRCVRHPNIVTLRGYCDEDNSRAILFNFVCNNTLFIHLKSGTMKPMQWTHRANLAVDLAKGLSYLHGRHIIHGNVTSTNVFVTHDFVPVIVEFSLSRNIKADEDVSLQDRSEDMNARGYLPPEYKVGSELSEKLDIYAFGVILFELVSGRAAFDRNNRPTPFLGEWGRETVKELKPRDDQCELLETMADPRLKGSEYDEGDMLRMIEVAELCTSIDPKERPLMPLVLEMLTGNIEINRSLPAPPAPDVPRSQARPDQDTPDMKSGSTMPLSCNDQSPCQNPPLPDLRGERREKDNSNRELQGRNHPKASSSNIYSIREKHMGNIHINRSLLASTSPDVPTSQSRGDHGTLALSYNDQIPCECPPLRRENDNSERASQRLNHPKASRSNIYSILRTLFGNLATRTSQTRKVRFTTPGPYSYGRHGTPPVSGRYSYGLHWTPSAPSHYSDGALGMPFAPGVYSDGYHARPSTPGRALPRNRSGSQHHGTRSSPRKFSSHRRRSLHSYGGMPMSPRRYNNNVVTKRYQRKSGGSKPERKGNRVKFANTRPTFLNSSLTQPD